MRGELRYTRSPYVSNLANGGAFGGESDGFFLPFPFVQGVVHEVFVVHFNTDGGGGMLQVLSHNLNPTNPTSIANLLDDKDVWALSGMPRDPIMRQLKPPYLLTGTQNWRVFNDSGGTHNHIFVEAYYTSKRVSPVAWAAVAARTHIERF